MDQQGRVVSLRGFNVDALTDPRDAELGRPAPLTSGDAQLIAKAGFDCVRLPIAWSLLQPSPGRIDRRYLNRILGAVVLLQEHGLRVVLDMHLGIGWGPRSEEPGWAQLRWIPDWRPIPTSPWNRSVSPRTVADQGYFWLSEGWQADLIAAWQAIAERLRDDPWVIGYDLYNEPHPLPIPPGLFDTRYLFPFYARAISSISRVDPHHLFFIEPPLFDDFPPVVEPIDAPNIVFAPHLYLGTLTGVPLEGTSPDDVAGLVARMRGEARTVDAPLWIGEVGVDRGSKGAGAYERAYLRAMDDGSSGWAWWQWRQNGGWGIRSADGRHLDVAALSKLATPYLQAAPRGVVTTSSWSSSVLHLRIRSGHAPVPVVVGWSGSLLGAPQASGACLAGSDWDAPQARLQLQLRAGIGCRIRVSPR